MGESLLGAAAPDFDEPIEMLLACHGRVQSHCRTLQRLATHLPQHGADAQARQAASNVLRYFDTAARHHHEDEEEDLLPALDRLAAGEDASHLRALVERILGEHQRMFAQWAALREPLLKLAAGESAELDAAQVARFDALYAGHIRLEEEELLPLARRLLPAEEVARIGRAMAARRTDAGIR